jgi:hypothetical protein
MTAIERDVLFTHFGQMQYEETKVATDEDLANADERDDLKPTEAEIGMQMNALEQPKLEAVH